jgi:SSS family solute:Na+ symporter
MSCVDWCVVVAYLGLMLGVGGYFARRNRTAEDYLLGGRRLPSLALGLSLFATLVSTLTYLSIPGEIIRHGPMLITQVAAHPLIFLLVGYGLIPLLMRQPVTSAYEILETRLGPGIRRAGAMVFLLLRFGWMATILFATSQVVLIPLLGIDPGWTALLCLGMGLLTAVYSSLGGIKAVVMTDAIQSLTMLTGAIATLTVISLRMGGVSGWWPSEWPAHWQSPSWGFDPQPRISFGILLISTTLWHVCTNGSDQMSIQRFLCTRDPASARRTLLIAQLTDVSVGILLALTGVALLSYYSLHGLADGQELSVDSHGDQLFPRFIMTEMPVGLSGVVVAAILSAALSSLSSGINSACAVLERDFLSGDASTSISRLRLLTWLVALVAIALSLLNLFIDGNLLERCFKIVNLLTVPLFVLFFLALFVPWANAPGAWLGLLSSIATAVSIAFARDLSLPISVSFVWMMPCALIVGVSVGTLSSGLFRLAGISGSQP